MGVRESRRVEGEREEKMEKKGNENFINIMIILARSAFQVLNIVLTFFYNLDHAQSSQNLRPRSKTHNATY